MLKIKRVLIASFFILSQFTLLAQNNTNSPYTRYGYGELADRSFGAGRAMGGVGYGLRSSKQINPLNPASYTSIDSLTFLFDFGVAGQVSWFNDGINKEKHTNGNVEYIAMEFPISRRIAVSAGMLPYSYAGYSFGELNTTESTLSTFSGKGGLNDLYLGLSIDIWKKRLSVGGNVGYLFGNIDHAQSMAVSGTGAYQSNRLRRVEVRDLKLDFGIQYVHPVSKTDSYTFGLAYSPGKKLNATYYDLQTLSSSAGSSVVKSDTITNLAFDIPSSYGFGVSYIKQNKLTLAADFLYEDWSSARFIGEKGDFKNRIRIAGGGEYIPNYQSRSFFSRVRYRAGVHYGNSYIKVKDSGYNEYGASLGFGLPLVDNRSLLNLSFEYVKVKPDTKNLIDEQYFRLTVNYTFNERWFFKFKVD